MGELKAANLFRMNFLWETYLNKTCGISGSIPMNSVPSVGSPYMNQGLSVGCAIIARCAAAVVRLCLMPPQVRCIVTRLVSIAYGTAHTLNNRRETNYLPLIERRTMR
jgi:hypothetical protein